MTWTFSRTYSFQATAACFCLAPPTSVYSATQRARKVVDERLPARADQPAPGNPCLKIRVDRYMRAIDQADVPAIVTMLSEDAGIAA